MTRIPFDDDRIPWRIDKDRPQNKQQEPDPPGRAATVARWEFPVTALGVIRPRATGATAQA